MSAITVDELYSDVIGDEKPDASVEFQEDFVTDLSAFTVAAQLLDESFGVETPAEAAELEERAFDVLGRSILGLGWLAQDESLEADVRGVAARMFTERFNRRTATSPEERVLEKLARSLEPLVRLGLALGLERDPNSPIVERLAHDPHPRVREEAQDILAQRSGGAE